MAKPFEIKAKGESSAELLIYGDIGEDWFGESVTAKDTAEELSKLDVENIDVMINSYGGSVSDGLAIFNSLRRHQAKVNIRIDGVAVSIASLIAMAGDTVEMAENALFMVHAPWGGAIGNAKEMREYADVLDTYAEAMSSSYTRKTGQDKETIMQMLTDGEDHWFTAAEAKEFGFVDIVFEEEMAAAASGFKKSKFGPQGLNHAVNAASSKAAQVAASTIESEVSTMPKGNDQMATTPDVVENKVDTDAIAEKAAKEALAAESKRRTGIREMFSRFENREGVKALQDSILDDAGISVEDARAKLLDHIGSTAEPINPADTGKVEITEDEADKFRAAASDAIMARAGVASKEVKGTLGANPLRGRKLLNVAEQCLNRSGVKTDGMDQMQIVSAAFTQSGSDFPILLENTMHKTLQQAYATVSDTWSRFCKQGSVSDFRDHNRYRVGSLSNLEAVNELGEFANKAIPDGEKESIAATTKGNIINISRQAVINDDLNAFVSLSASLGRAAKRTVEADVYALLALNSGLGPTMGDGDTLFHANHGNIGGGAAISMTAIDADRVLMAQQMDVGGNDYLDMRPEILLIPVGLGGYARALNESRYDPDATNKLQKPNQVGGLFNDIVDTPRMTGTRRYLFANPEQNPVIEVVFLDGNDTPYLELENGFSVDGARYKVRLDFGVGAVDYRGAVTDAGA